MPKAYVVCDIDVTDPRGTRTTARSPAWPARSTARPSSCAAVPTTVLEGDWDPSRLVILEFEDEAAAQRWWDSPEYEAAKAVRRANATSNFLMVQGA